MLRRGHPDFAPLATERLILRPARIDDIPALFAILGDREAMQHTHPVSDVRDCRRRVLVHEWHRRRERCAPWTAIRASDQKIIGWGGLFRDPFDPGWGIELGYWLDRSAWGAGYGSELAAASTAFADDVLKLPGRRPSPGR